MLLRWLKSLFRRRKKSSSKNLLDLNKLEFAELMALKNITYFDKPFADTYSKLGSVNLNTMQPETKQFIQQLVPTLLDRAKTNNMTTNTKLSTVIRMAATAILNCENHIGICTDEFAWTVSGEDRDKPLMSLSPGALVIAYGSIPVKDLRKITYNQLSAVVKKAADADSILKALSAVRRQQYTQAFKDFYNSEVPPQLTEELGNLAAGDAIHTFNKQKLDKKDVAILLKILEDLATTLERAGY